MNSAKTVTPSSPSLRVHTHRRPLKQFLRYGKRLAVMIMCIAVLLSLFGCSRPKTHVPPIGDDLEPVVDGPGSLAPTPWHTMELSRSDMYYPYNFNFTLTLDNGRYLATGYCADEDGNRYETEEGIEIPLEVIDIFDLGSLSDDRGSSFGDSFVMDAPIISLTLTYGDGTQKEKAIGESLSLEIYQALLPYFAVLEPQ